MGTLRAAVIAALAMFVATSAQAVEGITKPSRAPLELVVKYRDAGIAPQNVDQARIDLSGIVPDAITELPALDRGLRIFKFKTDRDLLEAKAALEADPEVERVERASWNTADFVPNDPYYPQQWDKPIISAEEAWDVESGNSNVLVFINDGAFNCQGNPTEPGNCLQSLSFDAIPTQQPEHQHGFHVWSIAAATLNNGVQFAGMAGTAQVALGRFLNGSGSGSSADALKVFNHVIALQKANPNRRIVMNMSWGGESFQQFNADAIAAFVAAGGVPVASAGNSARDSCAQPAYPASYAGVISVASTDEDDGLSSFSNFGTCPKPAGQSTGGVLLAAPGGFDNQGGRVFGGSNNPNSVPPYTWLASGTSMAAPQVTGAIANMLSMEPTLTLAQIIERLEANSDFLGLPVISGARLNAAAVLGPPKPGIRIAISCPSAEVNQGKTLTCTTTTRGIGGYTGSVGLTCGGVPGATCTVTPASVAAGKSASVALVVSNTAPIGQKTLTVTATGNGVPTVTTSTSVVINPLGTVTNNYVSTAPAQPFGKKPGCTWRPGAPCPLVVASMPLVVTHNLKLLTLSGVIHGNYPGLTSQLDAYLTSPAGTRFFVPLPPLSGADLANWRFTSTAFLKQPINGTWRLEMMYVGSSSPITQTGVLNSYELKIKACPAGPSC
jgi:hypothetical protein